MNPQQQQPSYHASPAPAPAPPSLPSVASTISHHYAPSPTPPLASSSSFQPTPLDGTSAYNSRATSTGLPNVIGGSESGPNTPLPTTDLEEDNNSSSTTGTGTGGNNTPAPPTQLPTVTAAQPPVKRSKALNFLKKKETKVNVKGTSYKIVDDEIILEDDERGETKIDENGSLLGGRQWKVHTFTSPMRTNPEKLYMLSIDAARCAGFRDSLYFFRRNPLIHKLSCSQAEKDRLIELGKLSGNLKSRAVTMVSARNVYKVMGATFVQDGKYILDDYYEGKSLALGHKPGEPAFIEPYDPEKDTGTLAVSKGNAPPGATSLGLNVLIGHPGKPKLPGSELISSQIGGGLHATFGGTGQPPFGSSESTSTSSSSWKKVKPPSHLTVQDWMFEYAKEVRDFNKRYQQVRNSHLTQISINPPGSGSTTSQENEEDNWELVQEEFTDEESESEVKPSPIVTTTTSTNSHSFQTQLPSISTPVHQEAPFDPSLPSLYGAANPTPSTSNSNPPSQPLPLPKKEKKKKFIRTVKRFNPIRGFYEFETNVPHVYRSTQPTRVIDFYRSDLKAHIFPTPREETISHKGKRRAENVVNGDAAGEEDEQLRREKKRKLELELAGSTKGGIASLEFISFEKSWNLESHENGSSKLGWESLIPGMWDFEAGSEMVEKVMRMEQEQEEVGEREKEMGKES
ncbi:hypothetical protein JCM5350_002537 [Sporobolomyces pararoseus]